MICCSCWGRGVDPANPNALLVFCAECLGSGVVYCCDDAGSSEAKTVDASDPADG